MSQAAFSVRSHNPDVLTCIANLSNDEVFTPPEFANQMLDSLQEAWSKGNSGKNIWENKNVTFLDPCTKSGVFLREIVKRLNDGLSKQIPDLTSRINHILNEQVFGIGITELTTLIARRSVYCSKYANGIHSVGSAFTTETGNIWYERIDHTWEVGRCKFCGANEKEYTRNVELETHAYKFTHCSNIQEFCQHIFGAKMHFDVIIGNPPYQLNDGGGASGMGAIPIYQHFVRQAKKLEPRYLSFVIPARWYAGGRGLDEFREEMLNDQRLRLIEDFPDSSAVFPGTHVKSGVCFFVWDRDNPGNATITNRRTDGSILTSNRPLREPGSDVFLRYNDSISIIKKVIQIESLEAKKKDLIKLPEEKQFSKVISSRKPYGIPSNFRGTQDKQKKSDHVIYQNYGSSYISDSEIKQGRDLIQNWKVFLGKAYGGDEKYPHSILSKPFVGVPGSVCTETYLHIGPFDSEAECKNVISYISTRLFRFLVLLRKPTQNSSKGSYSFVPIQDFSKPWTDERLYKKYNLTKNEILFIESLIRPMTLIDE
jgi:hypothetical protein